MQPTPAQIAAMHRAQRGRFLERLEREGAAAVLFSGSPALRNADTEHRFRPSSDFVYLTGFDEPECVLVLLPVAVTIENADETGSGETKEGGVRSVLFLREKNRQEEVWTGIRLGVEAAPERLGVDRAFPLAELWKRLPALLRGSEKLVYRLGEDEERDRHMVGTVGRLRAQVRGGVVAPLQWVDPALWLHEQRLVKDEVELAAIRAAAGITGQAHAAAMAASRPGGSEAEVDGLLLATFRKLGALGPAYTNIVAGGANACILHYVENDAPLRAGDLLLVDAGAEWGYYASDVTRTWPVDGRFQPEQRALYEAVLAAQLAAIDAVRPGNTFAAVHETAVQVLSERLIDLGLVKGSLDEVVAEERYQRFFMHRTGHWLGLDVHDCGAYHVDGASRELAAGMVTTVEPGLYVAPDDESVEERWRGLGVRIEDDVLVTASGHEVLSAGIPKTVEEVEAACAGEQLESTAAR